MAPSVAVRDGLRWAPRSTNKERSMMDTYYPSVATAWVCLESLWMLVYDQVRYKGNKVKIKENHWKFCNQPRPEMWMKAQIDEANGSNRNSGAIYEGGLWPAPGGLSKVATSSCRLQTSPYFIYSPTCERHTFDSQSLCHFWVQHKYMYIKMYIK